MEPNVNSSGMMNGMPPTPMESNKKIGPIIGVLVILLLIIIAVLYFFSQKLNTEPKIMEDKMDVESSMSTTTDQSTNIEADLNAQLEDVDYSF